MLFHLNKHWYRLTDLTNLTHLPKLNRISRQRNPQEKEIPFCDFGQYAAASGDFVYLHLCLCISRYRAVLSNILIGVAAVMFLIPVSYHVP
jgi:hypothetical protein